MVKLRYFLLSLFVLSLICVFGCWQLLPEQPKTPEELLKLLTITQIQCVEKIADKDNLVYLEIQEDERFITIGYNTGDELHAVLINESNNCAVEFHEIVARRHYSEYDDRWVMSKFLEFGARDLTGNQIPEIYIGLALAGVGPFYGDYTFYSKQANNSYKEIGRVSLLCGYRHSFDIIDSENEDSPTILISHDFQCDDWLSSLSQDANKTGNYEYLVTNNDLELVDCWRGSPDGQEKYEGCY